VKIIFIGGAGRSGTTLLDRLLGQADGFFSLGEIYHMWERSFIENQLCGCGKPFRECEFWQVVVKEAFGGFEKVDALYILKLQRSVSRIRHTPVLLYPSLRPQGFELMLSEYKQILENLYKAISKVSGSEVLIDSSKSAPHAFVLSEIPAIDLNVVHLVRDSRAVVYSWQRKKKRPEIHWKEEYMPRLGTLRGTAEWILDNWLISLLKNRVSKYKLINYEALTGSPKDSIESIGKWLGIEKPDLNFFVNDRVVYLGVNHTVSGNPIRFKRGEIKIKSDTEWTEKMSFMKKYLVGMLTYPFRRAHIMTGNQGGI